MLFQVENLACRRSLRPVFRNVGFALAGGDALLVTGPNGSGKSSLLRILAGLLPPAQGTVLWDGTPVDWDEHKTRLHYLGHRDAVKLELTVTENLDYWRALCGENDVVLPPLRGELEGGSFQEKPESTFVERTPHLASPSGGEECRRHLLDMFSLTALKDRPARILSAGQRRRLALARLTLAEVPLWLLDEPATSLDHAGQGVLVDLIAQHRAKGGIAIIASHNEMNVPDAQTISLAVEAAESA